MAIDDSCTALDTFDLHGKTRARMCVGDDSPFNPQPVDGIPSTMDRNRPTENATLRTSKSKDVSQNVSAVVKSTHCQQRTTSADSLLMVLLTEKTMCNLPTEYGATLRLSKSKDVSHNVPTENKSTHSQQRATSSDSLLTEKTMCNLPTEYEATLRSSKSKDVSQNVPVVDKSTCSHKNKPTEQRATSDLTEKTMCNPPTQNEATLKASENKDVSHNVPTTKKSTHRQTSHLDKTMRNEMPKQENKMAVKLFSALQAVHKLCIQKLQKRSKKQELNSVIVIEDSTSNNMLSKMNESLYWIDCDTFQLEQQELEFIISGGYRCGQWFTAQ